VAQEDVKALRSLADRAAGCLKDRLAAKEASGLATRLAGMDETPAEVTMIAGHKCARMMRMHLCMHAIG
jgi:hypothetical protein